MKHSVHTAAALRLLWAATFGVFALCALPASADTGDDDVLLAGAKLCTQYLPRHERQYGIPVHLLAAIASTESGRYHRALGLNLPWPWTINVEGRGYFFNTKEEAITAVQRFQQRGIKSIDVGCMQVNLHHHPNAFSSLEQAFDPAYNVAYAAQFLKQNFVDEGSWRKATADYHSHTQAYGNPYASMVYNAWSRIINKVADARAGRPVTVSYSGAEPAIRYHDAAAAAAADAIAHAPRPANSYESMHMHSISVSSSSRENGVLVIRPDRDDAQLSSTHDAQEEFVVTRKSSAAADSDTSVAHAVVHAANTAQPIATMADNGADTASSGARVVTIHAANNTASPGYDNTPHASVTHVDSDSAVASPSSSAGKNIFVFDN